VTFSPDEQLLASGGDHGMLRLWQVSDGALLQELLETARVMSVAFSPVDSRLLASASRGRDGRMTLWQASAGERLRQLRSDHDPNPTMLAFSPDGQWLAVGRK
jgi:WD40 repeat protein